MSRRYIAVLFFILPTTCLAAGNVTWSSGHHDILEGDTYFEVALLNDASADMWGGDVTQLGALDTSRFYMYGGEIDYLFVRYNSIVNIYGGILGSMGIYADENGLVNLYAKDIIYHFPPSEPGWIEGNYINNGQHFNFYVNLSGASHINIIPEPATIILLSFGSILLYKKR